MEIAELQGTKSGHAFLIGNGDSLNAAPFHKLKDEHTFAVNRIADIFKRTEWRPTYYVAVSSSVLDAKFVDWRDDVMSAIQSAEITFMCNHLYDRMRDTLPLDINIVPVECQHTAHYEPDAVSVDFWYNDLTKGVSKYGASLFAAAQIAVWMGFTELIFIGMDGYHAGKPLNFSDTYRNDAQSPHMDDENRAQTRVLELIKEAGERDGFSVKLADFSNGYGVLEKVDLNDII